MNKEEKRESKWSDMAWGIGWCFIFIGIGGCIALSQSTDNGKPLIELKTNANPH